jgi:hypothetical protein
MTPKRNGRGIDFLAFTLSACHLSAADYIMSPGDLQSGA